MVCPAFADNDPEDPLQTAALTGAARFDAPWVYLALAGASAALALMSVVAARFYRLNVVIRREVLEREKVERELRSLEERSRMVVDSAPFAVVITRIEDGKVLYVNPALVEIFRLTRPLSDLRPATEYWVDMNDRVQMIGNLREHGSDRRECQLKRDNGEPFWVQLSANRIHFEGEEAALIALLDIGERKELETRLEELAMTDYLTGLPNRRWFMELGREAASVLTEDKDTNCLSLLALDLDEFKAVNDTHGHAGGDRVLQYVANLLRNALETGESAGRLGGEEFGILLPGKDEAQAWKRAEAIRLAVASAPISALSNRSVQLSVSIGAATRCGPVDPDAGLEDLLRRADKALYQAKSNGRNRVEQG